jgi:resuscitation-promoting factor RpfB
MNIPSKLNILHGFYGKAKYAFLIVFSFSIIFLSFISHSALGESVVGTVQTRLSVNIDGRTQIVTTTQNNIDAALKQNNINLAENDITEPPLNTYLGGKAVNVNVIRAVPVLITDSNQSWAGKSAYTQPYDILKQLDVTIYPEDKVSADLILDPAAVGMAGQEVIIDRAPVYTIYVDGETKVVRSWTTNVSDLLTEKGISLGVNDIIEPPKVSSLTGVTEVTITRINYANVDETVSIPYQTFNQDDYNIYEGNSSVLQAGINGSKKQSVHIVYENGVEVERAVTSSEVTQAAQNKIVGVGVKPYNADMWWNKVISAANSVGISGVRMYNMMTCESNGNPSDSNGVNTGLFQYAYGTWLKARSTYGGPYSNALITNGDAQIYVTARKIANDGWGAWPYCGSR